MTLKTLWRRCLLLGLLLSAAVLSPQVSAAEPDAFGQSTQMIVVTTPDWNAVQGSLQRYERRAPHEAWHTVGEPVAIVVGTHGMGWGLGVVATDHPKVRRPSDPVKKEGDGKSPAGVFALGTAFGDASQPLPGLKLPYLTLTPTIECVDDVRSKFYNRLVDRSTVRADWNSSEHMRDVGEAYQWGVVVDHNAGAIPGGGSCVFLHIWGGPTHGTAGCTAMAQDQLQALLTWLDPTRKPLLVQLPVPEYGRLIHVWGLPPAVSPAHP